MKTHRIREAKAMDGTGKPHTFIEVTKDSWLEIGKGMLTHENIHHSLDEEKKNNCYNIRLASRAFDIGIIKDWQEAGEVKEEV